MIRKATVEDWDKIFAVNTRSMLLSYKYAAQQMIRQGRGGRIIGACSGAGKEGT
jgi:NAD(P)-dependent dehydrogenase (short-subunit alcohol dehydrogenase family)